MGIGVEPVGVFPLNSGGIGQVRVYHEDGMVWIAGYARLIGLSYHEVVQFTRWLEQYADFFQDRAANYYECRECGLTHHTSVQVCPTLSPDDGDSDWEYEADDGSYGTAKWT